MQVLSLTHQVKDPSKPREVDPLLRSKRMLFEEGNNPFVEVIQPPYSIRHPVTVIGSNHPTAKKLLERVEQLNITTVLNDSEFGEHLKPRGHLGMRADADMETTFAVNKPYYPLSV